MGVAYSVGRTAHTSRNFCQTARFMISDKLSGSALRGIAHSGTSHDSRGCPTLLDAVRKFNGNGVVFYSTFQNKYHPMPLKPLGTIAPLLLPLPCSLQLKPNSPTPLLPPPRFLKLFGGVRNPGGTRGIPDYYLLFDPVEYMKYNLMFQEREVHGTEPTWKPWIITDFAKRLERSLILLLVMYHKLDLCFINLTPDDLYICCDGTFKLKDTASFEKLTSDGVDKDYSNAADILWHLIQKSMGALYQKVLPDDQKNLFHLMKINASEHEYLIATNIALLPMAMRAVALRKFHGEILRVLHVGPVRDRILSQVDVTHWLKRTKGNSYLMKCLAYRKKFKPYEETAEDILEFHRNFDSHRYDYPKLAECDSDVIQYAYFSMLLPEVQQSLWDKHKLAHLFIEELFTDGMTPLLEFFQEVLPVTDLVTSPVPD